MASVCTTRCVDDARVPVRATYVNLYKWPESDAAFVRSVSSNGRRDGREHPRVVDSISCRQLYLRSYTFTRKESMPEKTKKCIGRVRERVVTRRRRERKSPRRGGRKNSSGMRRVKEVSCAALLAVFQRLLSCTTKVDVVD